MSELADLIHRIEPQLNAAIACSNESHHDLRLRSSIMARVNRELLAFAARFELPPAWAGQILLQLTRAKERGA